VTVDTRRIIAREGGVDRGLVELAQRGDADAFDALVRLVGDSCLAIASRILRDLDLAEDAVQSAFISAWRQLDTLRDADRFEPWLHRILTRACYAETKSQRRQAGGLMVGATDDQAVGDHAISVAERDVVERAFRRLKVEQRAVLVFHYYLDLPISEVADRLGLPLGTAKSRLHHAMAAMRASLEADARSAYVAQERLA
jgi:RNA polymerase sigma-70 factor (ECF subfamily)